MSTSATTTPPDALTEANKEIAERLELLANLLRMLDPTEGDPALVENGCLTQAGDGILASCVGLAHQIRNAAWRHEDVLWSKAEGPQLFQRTANRMDLITAALIGASSLGRNGASPGNVVYQAVELMDEILNEEAGR